MAKLYFSASGYGTKVTSFKTREDARKYMRMDAAGTADEHNGHVERWDDDECYVIGSDGQEVARWEVK